MIMLMSMVLFINHPIMTLIFILATSVYMSVVILLTNSFTWLVFMLLLIYFGGMMILFTYITSLAFDELEHSNNKLNMLYISVIILFILPWNNTMGTNQLNFSLYMKEMVNFSICGLFLILLLYLFLMLLASIMITSHVKKAIK